MHSPAYISSSHLTPPLRASTIVQAELVIGETRQLQWWAGWEERRESESGRQLYRWLQHQLREKSDECRGSEMHVRGSLSYFNMMWSWWVEHCRSLIVSTRWMKLTPTAYATINLALIHTLHSSRKLHLIGAPWTAPLPLYLGGGCS